MLHAPSETNTTTNRRANLNSSANEELKLGPAKLVCDLYQSGLSLREISGKTGLPREGIRLTLHKPGVKMRHRHPIYHRPDFNLKPDVALLLGLHAGDGWISQDWGISLSSKDRQMVKIIVGLVRRVLGVEPYVTSNRDHSIAVKSGHKQVLDFFRSFEFPSGRKAGTVKIRREVLASKDADVWIGFLKGAFSSDGSFWFKNNWGQCRFEVSSRGFRDGFTDLARRLGFQFRAYSYVHHAGHNKLPLHLAYLGVKDEVKTWMERIGSICDTHLRRYQRWSERIAK